MALIAKPKKIIDLAKIDDIQNEVFGREVPLVGSSVSSADASSTAPINFKAGKLKTQAPKKPKAVSAKDGSGDNTKASLKSTENKVGGEPPSRDLKISELLATAKTGGVRYTTRPYTVPRSLTIDLNRLKATFRTRELQYTQTELMEKMIRESLEIVTESNYHDLREKALALIKVPEQSSRRSVTLTEDTFFKMSELKADLAQAHGRRFSNDELLTMLLATAFAPLYEQGVL